MNGEPIDDYSIQSSDDESSTSSDFLIETVVGDGGDGYVMEENCTRRKTTRINLVEADPEDARSFQRFDHCHRYDLERLFGIRHPDTTLSFDHGCLIVAKKETNPFSGCAHFSRLVK